MARYYEETALIEFVKQYTPTIERETTLECVERAIRNAPTADVVPKSEVEKTLNIIEGQREEIIKLEKARRNSLPSYFQVVSEAKAIELGKEYGRREVARGIILEIDTLICCHANGDIDDKRLYMLFDELKKKYTEDINHED